MIGRHSICQRVRTAGIFRHIAADGARSLAGWIGRVEVALPFHCLRDFKIDDARLKHGPLILEIDLEDPIHAREGNHYAAVAWNRTAAQPGTRAPADDREAVLDWRSGPEPLHPLSIAGKTTRSGCALSTPPSYSYSLRSSGRSRYPRTPTTASMASKAALGTTIRAATSRSPPAPDRSRGSPVHRAPAARRTF